jgi:hypothetical protein
MSERYQNNDLCTKKLMLKQGGIPVDFIYLYGSQTLKVQDWGDFEGYWYFEKYPEKVS